MEATATLEHANGAPSGRSSVATLGMVAAGYLVASWAMNPVSSILPTITDDLGIDVTKASWLLNVYFVLLVGWVLISGRMGDAFGHGRVFRVGCAIFGLGSLVAILPGGYPLLLAARGVQGLGSALILGTSLALVSLTFRGPRLAWAVGVLTVSSSVASIAGVWINTRLVEQVSWHYTFVPPVILSAVVVLGCGRLPSVRRSGAAEVDWWGGLLLLGAVTLFLLGLNHLHEGPETFQAGAPYHLVMHAAAVVCFAAFLWRELSAAKPLIQLRLLGIPRLSTGVVANGIAHSSMLATGMLIPFLLEKGRGYSPDATAELILAMQVCSIGAALGGGWLYARYDASWFGILALGSIAAGLLVLGRVGADLPFAALFPVTGVLGVGLGAFTTVNNTAVMGSVPAEQRGFASGLVEMSRQLGHSVGVSISSGLLSGALAIAVVPQIGYREGFSDAASAMGLVATLGAIVIAVPLLKRSGGRLAGALASSG